MTFSEFSTAFFAALCLIVACLSDFNLVSTVSLVVSLFAAGPYG